MGRPKKAAVPAESAQELRDGLNVGTDVSEAPVPVEGAVAGHIIGPADESELLGCQDEAEAMPSEYAVSGCNSLNLRERPGMDTRIIVTLPRGVGVHLLDEVVSQTDGHWRRVRTGLLDGWVLSAYLEPVWH